MAIIAIVIGGIIVKKIKIVQEIVLIEIENTYELILVR
jgi:hypothetical protein